MLGDALHDQVNALDRDFLDLQSQIAQLKDQLAGESDADVRADIQAQIVDLQKQGADNRATRKPIAAQLPEVKAKAAAEAAQAMQASMTRNLALVAGALGLVWLMFGKRTRKESAAP